MNLETGYELSKNSAEKKKQTKNVDIDCCNSLILSMFRRHCMKRNRASMQLCNGKLIVYLGSKTKNYPFLFRVDAIKFPRRKKKGGFLKMRFLRNIICAEQTCTSCNEF